MSHGKQFTLYTHGRGPNGWKVAFVLEALGLTYHSIYLDFNKGEHKAPEFTQYNPNGRIPALIDHKNGDFVVWESDAIMIYLVDKYDTEKKLTFADGSNDKFSLVQWLFFQASGQGPYFGQVFVFKFLFPEKIPSAIERYQKETVRVIEVLDGVLKDREWLVGGKCTIADLSFITWSNAAINVSLKDFEGFDVEKYPAFHAWHKKLVEIPYVKKTLEEQAKVTAQ